MNKNNKKVGFFIVLISIMLLTPTIAAIDFSREKKSNTNDDNINTENLSEIYDVTKVIDQARYTPIEETSLVGYQNDIGYNIDVGDRPSRSKFVYAGEPANRYPGSGRTGYIDPDDNDDADCYKFSVCAGQTITASLSSTEDFDFELIDPDDEIMSSGDLATETDWYYIKIFANDGASAGEYTFSLTLNGQNDTGIGSDAGDTINQATSITPGSYDGYLDSNDWEDWYSFNANTGEGIFVEVDAMERSDYDIHLYNPSNELVHSSQFYGDEELEYPADDSGNWKIKIDIFPGWDESKWPDDYQLYGSGVYELELIIGGSADAPPELKSQRNIIPVAQTFIVDDDPTSTKDEYGYLAAVPAANYIENGERYVSPIVYQGVDIIPNWFTSIDQTTEYLISDWNDYLERHELTPSVFEISANPIQAAAEIAVNKWSSSNSAVLAVDGSSFSDESNNVLDKDVSFTCTKDITTYQADELGEFAPGVYSAPTYIGSKWGAIHIISDSSGFNGDTMVLTPRYEALMADWWPYESGTPGEDKDTFFPVSKPGIWVPHSTSISGMEDLKVIKYSGDRHKISIGETDSSLEVKITTQEESHLVVYLIDPEGNIRRPTVPHWNGGEIKPLHQWHGGHWEHDEDEYRHMIVEPHTEYSAEVHNPMQGTWTALVVPYLNLDTWEASFDGTYHITATVREHNNDRVSSGLSAANAAVIASLNHIPLLYITEDAVPSETDNAIEQLGITNIIIVDINDISSASISGSVTEYNSMQEVIDAIKDDSNSENYITITSFATGDGYFAPSGMIAAYHGSPVLNIGEAKEAYNINDMYETWREYDGDYYHGTRSLGALPMMNAPIELDNPPSYLDLILYYFNNDKVFPSVGLDLKLQWLSTIYDGIYNMINGYGLDQAGQEAFCFVSPRDTDIRDGINRILNGNNSYSGQIPVETTAFSSAVICRNILYPAIIYANPGRDITTSQHMNYFTGQYSHIGNNFVVYHTDAPKDNKNSFSSHGRFYKGHSIWDNHLETYNNGVSLSYYSGHGTGGSGISSQYKNIAEQFPQAETYHENLHDFEWWDSWAGYGGYDDRETKSVRDRAISIYNAEEPSLYDIIHFKWVDQQFENLHSEIEIWSSCTTAAHFGPIVYLSHGSAIYAGCTGSGYVLVDDLYKSFINRDFLIKGWTLGEAFSKNNWIVNRDYTTMDPSSIYGDATDFADGIHSVNVIFGDPTIQIYNPTWTEPTPIASS